MTTPQNLIGYYTPAGAFLGEYEGPVDPLHLGFIAEDGITATESEPGIWVFTDPEGTIVGSADANLPDDIR